MRRAGFFIRHFCIQNAPFPVVPCPCRLKRAQINELIYILIYLGYYIQLYTIYIKQKPDND